MSDATTDLIAASHAPPQDEIAALLDSLNVSPESNLIAVLQHVQERLGYLPPEAINEISRRTGIRLARVYGVVSFYAQFYTTPRGRHTVRCCCGTACHVKGAPSILAAIERSLGIKEGEATADMKFQLETVACLGTCFLAPVIMIDDQYFGGLTSQRVDAIHVHIEWPKAIRQLTRARLPRRLQRHTPRLEENRDLDRTRAVCACQDIARELERDRDRAGRVVHRDQIAALFVLPEEIVQRWHAVVSRASVAIAGD